ncbi:hypothetical protein EVAR_90095_1 [Eumeta japonica]|uniref:Uncharacterized protein n=1 Tax=Eumeta variegata TaxID=151549 RepID=A0A4C1X244_EUMVA|nr:hypothetical protein EVAR_90095_1 [Eumeta japonica]
MPTRAKPQVENPSTASHSDSGHAFDSNFDPTLEFDLDLILDFGIDFKFNFYSRPVCNFDFATDHRLIWTKTYAKRKEDKKIITGWSVPGHTGCVRHARTKNLSKHDSALSSSLRLFQFYDEAAISGADGAESHLETMRGAAFIRKCADRDARNAAQRNITNAIYTQTKRVSGELTRR